MKRKILSIVMALTVVIGIVFAGCGSKTDDKKRPTVRALLPEPQNTQSFLNRFLTISGQI